MVRLQAGCLIKVLFEALRRLKLVAEIIRDVCEFSTVFPFAAETVGGEKRQTVLS